jgi:hypothetical protein
VSGVLAQYASLDDVEGAIRRLREAGHTDLQVWSPVPAPQLEEALDIHSSPVGLWALIGGVTGSLTGLLLTAGTSLGYPLVTQGKPIVSVPPLIVVMFELTILLTGMFSLMAMLVHARRPKLKLSTLYRPEFSVDRFGVYVPAGQWDLPELEQLVRETGAVKVETPV